MNRVHESPFDTKFNRHATKFSYNAYAFENRPALNHDAQDDELDDLERLGRLVDSDRNYGTVIGELRAHPRSSTLNHLRNAHGLGEASFFDLLLTNASPGIAYALVTDFGANPSQRDVTNGMSAVDYAVQNHGSNSMKADYMRFLAEEYQRRTNQFRRFFHQG